MFLFAFVSAGRASLPKGWAILNGPNDPALASLSVETLIDRLQDAEPEFSVPPNRSLFWPIGGVPRVGKDVAFRSPAAVELVRRGITALPALLQHLTDGRRTRMIYAVNGFRPNDDFGVAYSDEYDARDAGHAPASVNTKIRRPLDEDGTYTFKVGDICFAAVGQIVGRELKAVRSRGEDADVISGRWSANPGDRFLAINSPVAQPKLADAARSDWAGLNPTLHLQLLQGQAEEPLKGHPLNAPGLVRLLFYYPDSCAKTAERLLHRKLASGRAVAGQPPPGDDTVTFWWQANLLEQLAPFRWDGLRAALLDIVHEADRAMNEELNKLPPGTWDPGIQSLGSDLALRCAKLLVHQGHDLEFKEFFTRRANLIEASLKAPAAPSADLGAGKFINSIQAQQCRKFVTELDDANLTEETPGPPELVKPPLRGDGQLGPVTVKKEGHGLAVHVVTINPSMDDVLLGRVVITHAQDDVGVTLLQEYVPNLAPVAVGMTSERELVGPPAPSLVAQLSSAASKARFLRSLQGWVELVMPKRDPNATVSVEIVASRFGVPLDQLALRKAGVDITLHDQASVSANNKTTLQTGAIFGAQARMAMGQAMQEPALQTGDVALSITDPNHRFLNVEFRGSDGRSLRYNHNGWYHAESEGTRFDVYRLGPTIPPRTTAVIWLRTEESLQVVDLDLHDVPLPQ